MARFMAVNNQKSDLFIKSLIGSQVVGLNIILLESNKSLVYKVKVQNKQCSFLIEN